MDLPVAVGIPSSDTMDNAHVPDMDDSTENGENGDADHLAKRFYPGPPARTIHVPKISPEHLQAIRARAATIGLTAASEVKKEAQQVARMKSPPSGSTKIPRCLVLGMKKIKTKKDTDLIYYTIVVLPPTDTEKHSQTEWKRPTKAKKDIYSVPQPTRWDPDNDRYVFGAAYENDSAEEVYNLPVNAFIDVYSQEQIGNLIVPCATLWTLTFICEIFTEKGTQINRTSLKMRGAIADNREAKHCGLYDLVPLLPPQLLLIDLRSAAPYQKAIIHVQPRQGPLPNSLYTFTTTDNISAGYTREGEDKTIWESMRCNLVIQHQQVHCANPELGIQTITCVVMGDAKGFSGSPDPRREDTMLKIHEEYCIGEKDWKTLARGIIPFLPVTIFCEYAKDIEDISKSRDLAQDTKTPPIYFWIRYLTFNRVVEYAAYGLPITPETLYEYFYAMNTPFARQPNNKSIFSDNTLRQPVGWVPDSTKHICVNLSELAANTDLNLTKFIAAVNRGKGVLRAVMSLNDPADDVIPAILNANYETGRMFLIENTYPVKLPTGTTIQRKCPHQTILGTIVFYIGTNPEFELVHDSSDTTRAAGSSM